MRNKKLKRQQPEGTSERIKRWGNHPFFIPVATFLILFFIVQILFINAGGTTVGATDTKVVNLSIDNKSQVVPTRAATVGLLLQKRNIQLQKDDIVTPGVDTPIENDYLNIKVYRARPVQVVDGTKKTIIYTAEPNPGEVAKKIGLTIYPEDKLQTLPVDVMDTQSVLKEGVIAEQIVIDRATEAHLNLYGTPVTVRTHAETVGDLLTEKEISLNEGDTIQPDPNTPLTPNTEVFLTRVGTQVVQVEEAIEPPAEYVDDFDLVIGSSQVRDAGKPGRRLVTYEIVQENGIETSRRVIQEIVIEQAVRKIVARGRKSPVIAGNKAEIMAAAGISPNEYFAADFIISHESGWRVNALNSRGCAGLGQACPGSKLAAVCPSWQSDAVCQMKFFSSYARGRYGSWSNAYDTWLRQRWW